ncbi:O-antigen ligase family protein [Streptomyces phyllanthi]|uniref:O-antigen ligase family protein n=1 Tax=Streptomyces phyllanthi TaxID=1803180 RepID=UPI003633DF8F
MAIGARHSRGDDGVGSTGTESAADAAAAGERRNVSDTAGVILLGTCAAWSLITAAAHDGRPEGMLLAVLALAAGYASGRICGALLPVAAPCAAALIAWGLATTTPHFVTDSPLIGPLGRTGATTALLVLATGAACCAAWAARGPVLRSVLRLPAAGVTVTAALLGSATATAACAAVLLCSLAAARVRRRVPGLVGLGLATALATGTAWAVAEGVLPDGLTDSLEGQLTPHRVQLWRDALDMAHREPALGVGPGRFGELSPTVAQSLTPDGKPHSAPLQLAAEQGLVGVALLAAVFCWVLCALWRAARPTPVVLTAGASLTALAVVATVGNALSFTAVTAGAGVVAGIATARPMVDAGARHEDGTRARGDRSEQ